MVYTESVKFWLSGYITQKYVDWRGKETGNKKSIARFARDVLKLSPQIVNEWMNRGKIPRKGEYINALAAVYGEEVYSILGIVAPGKEIIDLSQLEPADRAQVQDVHPHRFRHTFAVNYLRNGGDIYTLQMILGHSSLNMVRHYLSLAQADLDAAHRRASPVENMRL
jgi:hypothetical protein